jgi:hypothetical protein
MTVKEYKQVECGLSDGRAIADKRIHHNAITNLS